MDSQRPEHAPARPEVHPQAAQHADVAPPNTIQHNPALYGEQGEVDSEQKTATLAMALANFRTVYPGFEDAETMAALRRCWKLNIDMDWLIDTSFEKICAARFAVPEDIPPRAEGMDDESLLQLEIDNMAAAMKASQASFAAEKPPIPDEKDMTVIDLAAKYQWSVLVKTAHGDHSLRHLFNPATRDLLLKLLSHEKNCKRWWPKEPGVAGYFNQLAEELAPYTLPPTPSQSSVSSPSTSKLTAGSASPSVPTGSPNDGAGVVAGDVSKSGRKRERNAWRGGNRTARIKARKGDERRTWTHAPCSHRDPTAANPDALAAFLSKAIEAIDRDIIAKTCESIVPKAFEQYRPITEDDPCEPVSLLEEDDDDAVK